MPDVFKSPIKKSAKTLPQITTAANLPTGPLRFFTNFRLYPEGITLENQEADEIILLFLRRDLFTNFGWVVISVFLLFLPFFLTFLPFDLTFSFFTPPFLIVINLFYYLLVIGYVLANFTNWFFNISIVTNQRVLDLDYSNLTYKHVGATTIDNVEDISYIQAGFIRSFFDYGNVLVQTRGEVPNFNFNEVPRPAIVVDIILDLIRGIHNG